MRIALLPALGMLAVAAPAAPAFDDVVVSPRGTVGPVEGKTFRIGRTVVQQVRRVEGRPDDSALVAAAGGGGSAGRALTYFLRNGKGRCYRTYEFTSARGRTLQDFQSNCRHLKTANGTRVGMTFAQAEANEGATAEYAPMPLCATDGYGISTHAGGNWLVVWLASSSFFDPEPPPYRNVTEIALYGPKSVSVRAATKSPTDCAE